MFSKYKLNQVPIWGAYYDPIKQIDSIPIIEEEEITNVDMRLTWDSENRLKQVNNNSHDARYLYDSGGQRVLKRGSRTEIVYPTQFIQLDRAKKLYTKHIFLGTTRISSKLCSITNYFKDIEFEKRNNYTYHPDHLGSTSFVSDFRGEIYEYYQYTPYGEIWAEKSDILDKITHLFTSKELDAESGFYYFGARYLEPMTSRWISCDPILGEYLDGKPAGGVYNPINLNLYHYCANSPLNYIDPDGESTTVLSMLSNGTKTIPYVGNFIMLFPVLEDINMRANLLQEYLESGGTIESWQAINGTGRFGLVAIEDIEQAIDELKLDMALMPQKGKSARKQRENDTRYFNKKLRNDKDDKQKQLENHSAIIKKMNDVAKGEFPKNGTLKQKLVWVALAIIKIISSVTNNIESEKEK